MSGEAAGPAEQAESGNLTQHIVGDHGRRLPDLRAPNDARARGYVAKPLLGAGCGDDHFLGKSRPEAKQARAQDFVDEGVLLDLEKTGFFRFIKGKESK